MCFTLQENQDVVQAYFRDDTDNTTLKLLVGLRWSISNCKGARHILFVDDDHFVSTFNMIRSVNGTSGVALLSDPMGLGPAHTEGVAVQCSAKNGRFCAA